MKNNLLVLLGAMLVAIVAADWNTATWQVNTILATIGTTAFLVGVLSSWKLSPQYSPAYMASHVDGIPQPRTKVRAQGQ